MHLSDGHHFRKMVSIAFTVPAILGLMHKLRETDEAWERTSEYEGFRPVPGMR